MAAAALVITAISAVGSAVQTRKASKAQRKQNKIQNKIAAISRQRNVKRSIAASRIQTAQQQALGFQLGVSGGTAVQGAVQGVRGDVATSIGQSNLQLVGQEFSAGFADDASRAQETGALFGAAGSIAGGFVGSGGAQNRAALSSLVSG